MSKVKEMSEAAVKAREVLEAAGLTGFIVVQNIEPETNKMIEVVLEGQLHEQSEVMLSEILLEKQDVTKLNAAKYLIDHYKTEIKTKYLPIAKGLFEAITNAMETEEAETEEEESQISELEKSLIHKFTTVFLHDIEANADVERTEMSVAKIKQTLNEVFPLEPFSRTDVMKVAALLGLKPLPLSGKGIAAKYSLRLRPTETVQTITEKPMDSKFGEVLQEEAKDLVETFTSDSVVKETPTEQQELFPGFAFAKTLEDVTTGEYLETTADDFISFVGSEMQAPILLESLRLGEYFVDIHKNTFFFKAL